MKTESEMYGIEYQDKWSNHLFCERCGSCITCKDCKCKKPL